MVYHFKIFTCLFWYFGGHFGRHFYHRWLWWFTKIIISMSSIQHEVICHKNHPNVWPRTGYINYVVYWRPSWTPSWINQKLAVESARATTFHNKQHGNYHIARVIASTPKCKLILINSLTINDIETCLIILYQNFTSVV